MCSGCPPSRGAGCPPRCVVVRLEGGSPLPTGQLLRAHRSAFPALLATAEQAWEQSEMGMCTVVMAERACSGGCERVHQSVREGRCVCPCMLLPKETWPSAAG